MTNMVLGVFTERNDAEGAINELEGRGYNPKDFSIVMKNKEEAKEMAEETGAGDVAGGAAKGATTGAMLGGLAGLIASFALPGLGAFFIGGPIAAALGLGGAAASTVSGAATGALAGGIVGALTNMGVSDEDAKDYEKRVNEGGILLIVPALSGEEREVSQLLRDQGAEQVKSVQSKEDTKSSSARSNSARELRADESRVQAQYSEVSRRGIDDKKGTGRVWHGDPKGHSDASRGIEQDDE